MFVLGGLLQLSWKEHELKSSLKGLSVCYNRDEVPGKDCVQSEIKEAFR